MLSVDTADRPERGAGCKSVFGIKNRKEGREREEGGGVVWGGEKGRRQEKGERETGADLRANCGNSWKQTDVDSFSHSKK